MSATATARSGKLVVVCDTREQRIPPFPDGVTLVRATLKEGDYSTPKLVDTARIERKSVADLIGSLTHGRVRLECEADRLRAFAFRCIVVEGSAAEASQVGRMHPNALLGSLASLHARWGLPTIFLESPEAVGRYIAGVLRRLEEAAK